MDAASERHRPFHERAMVWLGICIVSALPSFLWAMNEYDPRGMASGVALFALAYAVISGTEVVRGVMRAPFVKRTVQIGYGTRLCVSILFPIGVGVDLWFGLISTGIGNRLFEQPRGFSGTLTTTLIQGALLNIALAMYMGVIYGVQRLFARKPARPGFCISCGYDLRGSPVRCPECGTSAAGLQAGGSCAGGRDAARIDDATPLGWGG